jgi:hypothetical protein
MRRYAQGTKVGSDRSKAEIERLLSRYGADGFGYLYSGRDAMVAFRLSGRSIKIRLPLPDRDDPQFTHTRTGRKKRNPEDIFRAHEQATRQSWRALLLVMKAKMEAIAAGISTLDDEFLSFMVLESGQTVGELLQPALESGKLSASRAMHLLTE